MRDDFATCPRCETALDHKGARFVCLTCEGVLVPESDVMTLLSELATPGAGEVAEPRPLPLEIAQTAEPPVRCPRCLSEMMKHALHGLTIDRCMEHGIWFDGNELQQTLNRAGVAHLKHARAFSGEKVAFGLSTAVLVALTVIRFIYF